MEAGKKSNRIVAPITSPGNLSRGCFVHNTMKTIELSDELYERLVEMAREVATQDNRCTSKPYFFQIREDHRIHGMDTGYADGWAWVDRDDPECSYESGDEDMPDELKEADEFDDQVGTFVKTYWKKSQTYKGAFLRESSVKDHIRLNHYHYSNPVDYLQGAFRNPDLELIFELLATIAGEPKP